jgi:hypothetical protein
MRHKLMKVNWARPLYTIWDAENDLPLVSMTTTIRKQAIAWRDNLRRRCCGDCRCRKYVVRRLIVGGIITKRTVEAFEPKEMR